MAVNHFSFDTEAEFKCCNPSSRTMQAPVIWPGTGLRAEREPNRSRVRWCESTERPQADFRFVYDDALPLWDKMKAIATKIYGAAEITADGKVRKRSSSCRTAGTDTTRCASPRPSTRSRPTRQLRGAPSDHAVNIREVRLAAGAEFIVMVCGES